MPRHRAGRRMIGETTLRESSGTLGLSGGYRLGIPRSRNAIATTRLYASHRERGNDVSRGRRHSDYRPPGVAYWLILALGFVITALADGLLAQALLS